MSGEVDEARDERSEEMLSDELTDFILKHYKKILILERNKLAATAVDNLMRAEGYLCTVVTDKDEAIELASQKRFDTLIVSEGTSADGLLIRDLLRDRNIGIKLHITKDFGTAIMSGRGGGSYEKLNRLYELSVSAQVQFLEMFQPNMAGHSARLVQYCEKLAKQLEMTDEMKIAMRWTGYFHNLSALIEQINQVMKDVERVENWVGMTPQFRFEDMLKYVPEDVSIQDILKHLQERWDGKGYPDGLTEEQIPMIARIIAVVDIYLHMVTGSQNRKAIKRVNAMDQLIQNAGTAFDPNIVRNFVGILKEELTESSDSDEQKEEILIVDDSVDDSLLKLKLRDEGYRVAGCNTSREAIARIRDNRPDLIISEVDLPDLDGFKFIEYIKNDKETRQIPFLFLSSRSDASYVTRGLRLGADDFIQKPFNMEVLFLKINRALSSALQKQSVIFQEQRGVRGSLQEMGIMEIVQILGAGGRTALLQLNRDGEDGLIYLVDGQVFHVAFGDLEGEDAFFHLVSWVDGEFAIHPGLTNPRKNIFTPNDMLLLRAFHNLDETRRKLKDA